MHSRCCDLALLRELLGASCDFARVVVFRNLDDLNSFSVLVSIGFWVSLLDFWFVPIKDIDVGILLLIIFPIYAVLNWARWHAIWYGVAKRRGWCCWAWCCFTDEPIALPAAAISSAITAWAFSVMVVIALVCFPECWKLLALDFLFWAVFYACFVAVLLRLRRQWGKEPLLEAATPEAEGRSLEAPQQAEMSEATGGLFEALMEFGQP